MNKRWNDSKTIKITQGMLISILIALIGIIGWFFRGWMEKTDKGIESCLEAKNKVISVETIIPEILKSVNRIENKLDRHINRER